MINKNSQVVNVAILEDKSSSGRIRPWADKKSANEKLEAIYKNLSFSNGDYYYSKSNRLHDCATYLTFDVLTPDDLTRLRLNHMNSCRVRLCPMCSWRRSLKIGSHARKIFSYIETDESTKDKYTYLFLTLTIPNVKSDNLDNAIDLFMSAWDKLTKRREFQRVVVGWYRGLEITHNHNPKSNSYDTYHPHFHCVLVVPKSYKRKELSRGYITHKKWCQLWAESIGYFVPTNYTTQKEFVVNFLERFRQNVRKGKKSFSYKVSKKSNRVLKIKCSDYPNITKRTQLANDIWNMYIKSLYRSCNPITMEVPYTKNESLDEMKRIKNSSFLCKVEKEHAIKMVGSKKKRVFSRGVCPQEWITNHSYNNLMQITAYRLMLQVWIDTIEPKDKDINSDNPLECSGLLKAIVEVTKYTVKDKDYILPWNWELSTDIVATLDNALDRRRLVAWGGLLSKIRDKLNLDDEIDGDLIHVDCENAIGLAQLQLSAFWNTGLQQYIITDISQKIED